MKTIIFQSNFWILNIVLLSLNYCSAQSLPTHTKLSQLYETYQEASITNSLVRYQNIEPLIEKRRNQKSFKVLRAGSSIENKPIYLVQVGQGKIKVLLWSQMHGDEPTATMALMDIFNFFEQKDALQPLREKLLNQLSIYFIPMLNPDGAERVQRQNAIGVDINRDALQLQTPEAQILKNVRDEIKPEWGFNLHDQSTYYSVGNTSKPATISFLAPAYNAKKEINSVRGDAMKLIVGMNQVLQKYIPGQVAKYADTFEPRAFGDNMQKWGTRTILIESGGHYDDPDKQYIRKMNFIAIMCALEEIANSSYTKHKLSIYEAIPLNTRNLYDLILTRAKVERDNKIYNLDLAFNRNAVAGEENFYYKGQLAYIGDLSTSFAYKTFNASDYKIVMGKVHPKVFETILDATQTPIQQYLAEGYTTFKVMKMPPLEYIMEERIQFILPEQKAGNDIQLNTNPSFFLEKNGKKEYVVVNGQLLKIN
jgi:hypothetical protein